MCEGPAICRGTILRPMHVSSVNLARGSAQSSRSAGALTSTGIHKRPTGQPVEIGPLGLSGDTIWSKKHHGGPDQAVYVYGEDDYAWWAAELGRPLEPGTFGENLTVAGLATGCGSFVGDRLHVGDARRARGDVRPHPVRNADRAHGHQGVHAALPQGGAPRPLLPRDRDGRRCTPAMPCATSRRDPVLTRHRRVRRDVLRRDLTREQLERALAAPICERGRRDHEDQLAALRSP